MTLQLLKNASAIGFGNSVSFGASGGMAPYTFSLSTNNTGASINPFTGLYQAPYRQIVTAQTSFDIVTVTDSLAQTASSSIQVGGVLELICDILQSYFSLASDHIYLWDLKINEPTDSQLYIAVSMLHAKPFGSSVRYVTQLADPLTNLFSFGTYGAPANPGTVGFNSYSIFSQTAYFLSYDQYVNGSLNCEQSINMASIIDIDLISRSTAARDQKELIPLALQSPYSEYQQEANGFYIAKLPVMGNFINLSNIDGAAIPYRYKISFQVQYCLKNIVSAAYFNQFTIPPSLVVNA